MKFQVLSHAGLLVEHAGVQVLCDPWLIGSTYWRSWWNYPPVSRELVASLKPDYIYLTHIHWDHFQSASLKLFPRDTVIMCPKGHFGRMKRDLNKIGFHNVRELRHGETVRFSPDFRMTSYSFDLLCDSAVVFDGPHTTLLNLNDCKLMGWPLRHLLSRHRRPDFVFCSHSSANSRACYDVIDDPTFTPDDAQQYVERFYQFAAATNARYAIPFASNQCYLHRDTYQFNDSSRTPMTVKEYWDEHQITSPKLQVMISGDSWSEDDGFELTTFDWFTDRHKLLRNYQTEQAEKLEAFYAKEQRGEVSLGLMTRFFGEFFQAIPWFVRRSFKGHPIVYVLHAGERRMIFQVDVHKRTVTQLENVNDKNHPLQIHVPAHVMRHALGANIVAHLGIGKRVRYRVTQSERAYAERFKSLIDLFEYEILPLRNWLRPRAIETVLRRWREVLLYAFLLKDKLLYGTVDLSKHLAPPIKDDKPSSMNSKEDHQLVPSQ